ncbi:MAG: MATE family efflux transporter [Candidatus Bruticola sp.]
MEIKLSDHFTYSKLLRFVLPSMAMMLFISTYSVVDGLFVSNYVGKSAFAATNFIFPVMMITGSVGFMLGTGGTAVTAKTLGEGKHQLANRYFSMIVLATAILGIILGVAGYLAVPSVAHALGAEGELLRCSILYGRINMMALPFFMLQHVFQSFFIAAERPKLGFAVTLLAGFANMFLDALFIIGFGWGLTGAAVATSLSQVIGSLAALIYFIRPNGSLLHLGPTEFYGQALLQSCLNGSSELMSGISSSVLVILYNFQLLRFIGENGVAAYGVIGYLCFIFSSIFVGYSIGAAPIISYHYGAENAPEIKNVLQKSIIFTVSAGIGMALLSLTLADPIVRIFVGYDQELTAITKHGLSIYSIGFAFFGFGIYGSSFFTALNNGLISAIIAFTRTLVFQSASVMILPRLFGVEWIWASVIVAESASLIMTLIFLYANKKKYGY